MPKHDIQPFPTHELACYSTNEVRLLNALLSQFSNLDMKPLTRALASVTQKYLGDAFTMNVTGVYLHERPESAAPYDYREDRAFREQAVAQCLIPELGQHLLAAFSLTWAKSVVDRLLGGSGDLPGQLAPLTPMEEGVFEFFILKLLQALRDNNPTLPCSIWEYEGLLSSRSKTTPPIHSPLSTELRLQLKGKLHSTLLSLFFDGHALLRTLSAGRQLRTVSDDNTRYLSLCEHMHSAYQLEVGRVYLTLEEQNQLEEGDILLFDDVFSSLDQETVKGDAKIRFDILPNWAFTAEFDHSPEQRSSGKRRLILNRFEEEHPYGT